MTDYNYWFAYGKNPIPTEKFTPSMLAAIRKMLADPEESWWVVDGALMALKLAPAKDIEACKPLIMPWTELLDTLLNLVQLREPDAGWQPLGKVKPAELE